MAWFRRKSVQLPEAQIEPTSPKPDPPSDKFTSTAAVSVSDRFTEAEISTCERSTSTTYTGVADASIEARPFQRSVVTETDPLWPSTRVFSVESETESPDLSDPYFWCSGNGTDLVDSLQSIMRRVYTLNNDKRKNSKHYTSDQAFDGVTRIKEVTDINLLHEELLRLEARVFVMRRENEGLKKFLVHAPAHLDFLSTGGLNVPNFPEKENLFKLVSEMKRGDLEISTLNSEDLIKPPPPPPKFLVVSDNLPVTFSRSPNGEVIGRLRKGDVVVGFRVEDGNRVPLKPRGWTDLAGLSEI